jgi:hypothetical protein
VNSFAAQKVAAGLPPTMHSAGCPSSVSLLSRCP